MKCAAKTKSGRACKNEAVLGDYCKVHDPKVVAEREAARKARQQQEDRYNEVLDVVDNTCKVKGWACRISSVDEDNFRYASLTATKRFESSSYAGEEVVGQFNLTVDSGVKVSHTNTTFHGYGLADLQGSIMNELGRLPWLVSRNAKRKPDSNKNRVLKIISRFHVVAGQLRRRYNGRPTIAVGDEYDVQDLFHALLKIDFEDVRPEEFSPSRGGASSRLDFLLKAEKIVVEVKCASKALSDKKIGEQLIVDIERYREHPDCDVLICFVYDPEMQIRNPTGLERDLSREEGGLEVKVLVAPK